MQQLPGRPEPVLIDELDDGNQLLQLFSNGVRSARSHRSYDAFKAVRNGFQFFTVVLHRR